MTSLHSVDAANSAARGGGSEATEEPTNPSACQQRNDFSRNRRCGVSNHLLVRGRKSSQLRGFCSHLRSSTRVIGTRSGFVARVYCCCHLRGVVRQGFKWLR